MKPGPVVIGLVSFILFAGGTGGYAAFTYAERHQALKAKLDWANQQGKIMTRGIEDLARERKKLEDDQLDFAARVADQEKRLDLLEKERRSLLTGIRRIAARNHELVAREEAAESVLGEAGKLKRNLSGALKKARSAEAKNKRLETEIKKVKDRIGRERAGFRKRLSESQSRLKAAYEKKTGDLEAELKGLRSEAVESARRTREQAAQARELEILRSERQFERSAFYYNMGVVYTRHGMFRDAIGMYEKALDTNPDDAAAHHNLGILYEVHMASREKAIPHYERFLELSGDEAANIKVRNWIDEAYRGIGHVRDTPMRSSRDAFEKLLAPTN